VVRCEYFAKEELPKPREYVNQTAVRDLTPAGEQNSSPVAEKEKGKARGQPSNARQKKGVSGRAGAAGRRGQAGIRPEEEWEKKSGNASCRTRGPKKENRKSVRFCTSAKSPTEASVKGRRCYRGVPECCMEKPGGGKREQKKNSRLPIVSIKGRGLKNCSEEKRGLLGEVGIYKTRSFRQIGAQERDASRKGPERGPLQATVTSRPKDEPEKT